MKLLRFKWTVDLLNKTDSTILNAPVGISTKEYLSYASALKDAEAWANSKPNSADLKVNVFHVSRSRLYNEEVSIDGGEKRFNILSGATIVGHLIWDKFDTLIFNAETTDGKRVVFRLYVEVDNEGNLEVFTSLEKTY